VTWTLAAFAILFCALAAGYGWYERTHPSSKVLALVATLAALAALGRVAFAPLPNVKPTTDIVVIAGFALGAAPGFAVGATAALTSNLVFGEGPWTPWQMAAWGACGILGALLARATRHDVARWQLAATCALAGAGYGLVLDAQEWLLYAPERTWAQYVVVSGSSLAFNIAHVIGNVIFALAFGPLLIRMLERFRARCDVQWRALPASATGSGLIAIVAVLVGLSAVAPQAHAASPGSRALGFLQHAQNRDGGWGTAKGAGSSPLYSAWVLLGQAAAQHGRCDAAGVRYVQRTASAQRAAGDLERTILALRACRKDSGSLGRRLSAQRRADGSVGGLVNLTSFAIFAFRATGASSHDGRVRKGASFVAGQQNRDGGFSYGRRGGESGVDDTAAAVEALVTAGRSPHRNPIARAVRFLRLHQQADGGFGATAGLPSNAQSTAWAIQALVAAGIDPERVRRHGARSPLAYLRSLQAADGSVRYSRTSRQTPVWVTAQALAALARRPLPIQV
jgi:energy-coupling factor transport system substrate-specific component